jgi:two-component system sensor histidine kinase KdpD
MEQVLVNLIHNAAIHTASNSEITVNAVLSDEMVFVSVCDDGPGISQEDLPHMFEKFFRGSHASPGGTGLGLSICKGIIEAHGGIINAGNRPGGGAIFTIALPCLPQQKRTEG